MADDFLGHGARDIALALLKRERIDRGMIDARSGTLLKRGFKAGRQATMIASLSWIITTGNAFDQYTRTWRDRVTTPLERHSME